jgi:hypothetical protein
VAHACDRVIVLGAKRTTTFTVNYPYADWTVDQETAYNAGASGDAEYMALGTDDRSAKETLNDIARGRPELKRVYRYFKVASDGSFFVVDWKSKYVNAVVSDAGAIDIDHNQLMYPPTMRLLHFLPLLLDHTYTGDLPASIVDNSPSGTSPEFLRPFALLKDANGKYWTSENMAQRLEQTTNTVPFNAPIGFQIQDDDPGVILTVHGGTEFKQHFLGNGGFTGTDVDDPTKEAILSSGDIWLTLAMELDDYLQSQYPQDDADLPQTDHVNTLVIDYPELRMDYVMPHTIVATTVVGGTVETNGGFIRNDWYYAQSLARVAYSWYSVPRTTISITRNHLDQKIRVGQLLTTIGDAATQETINSVVTKVMFDTLDGSVNYFAQFAELDIRGI